MTKPLLRYRDGMTTATVHLTQDVRVAQLRLLIHGYTIEVDGKFGAETESCVKLFQTAKGLRVDGIIGPATWSALLADPGQKPEPKPAFSRWEGLVVAEARRDIGQREKPNNSGFLDAAYERLMRQFGWFTSAAWCAFRARMKWLLVFAKHPAVLTEIKARLGGGCIESWRRASAPGSKLKTGRQARPGAIGYYRHSRATGHAVTVMDYADAGGRFPTTEGNSNQRGGREGVEVASFADKRSEHDANLLGFVYVPDPEDFE